MKYLAPAFLWALVILWLCAIPGQDIPSWKLLSFDKAGHAFIFFTLTILLFWGFFKQKRDSFFHNYFLSASILIAIIYGGTTELMQQYLFENRTADLLDFAANSIGAATALAVYFFLLKKKLFMH
ncbi:MAG: VanZ family protein [Bacteroidia bacterium]